MKNAFWVREDTTAIVLNSWKYGRMEATISTSKLPRAQEFAGSWYALYSPIIKSFYCVGNVRKPDGKSTLIYLHRWITDCPDDLEVDHFNNRTLDNTDGNLRFVKRWENQQNRKGLQRNCTSGYRGVSYDKSSGKWIASLKIKGKSMRLGAFDSAVQANEVIVAARAEHMPFSKDAAARRMQQ